MSDFVVIVHKGVLYKIRKMESESLDIAYRRAWIIAKDDTPMRTLVHKECLSHISVNEKIFGMNYNDKIC